MEWSLTVALVFVKNSDLSAYRLLSDNQGGLRLWCEMQNHLQSYAVPKLGKALLDKLLGEDDWAGKSAE
jgi:hypothetical protein